MKKTYIIILLSIIISLSVSQEKRKWFEWNKTHIGVESWLIPSIPEEIRFSQTKRDVTNLTGVDNYNGEDYIDDYWSIQYTVKDKWVLRYSSYDVNENISGPIGPDKGNIQDHSDDSQYEYSYFETFYVGSGRQTISKIISLGYPFTIKKIQPNKWFQYKEYNIDLILFLGLSFNKISDMDVYETDEWIGNQTYFWDLWETVKHTDIKNTITPSIIISIPMLYLQSSVMYNGHHIQLMFGYGI